MASYYKDTAPNPRENEALIAKMTTPGMEKEAAVTLTSYIRDFIREDSFVADKIMTEQKITADDLDLDLNLDKLRKIVEIEPTSSAFWISFRGIPPSTYIQQSAIEVPFGLISTEETVKNIFELKTRRNDVRKIIEEQHIKEILAQQDGKFIEIVNQACADLGFVQNYPGGFTLNNFTEAKKPLLGRKLQIGSILINTQTAQDILKWKTDDIGFTPVEGHFSKGLTVTTLQGIPLIITNKVEYVPNNTAYFFAQEDFLGKFFTLEDSTMWFEQDRLYIKFFAYKCLGMYVRGKGCQKATFNN